MSDEKKRTYQSETLGLPPLQMVLVHHEKNRTSQPGQPSGAFQRKDNDEEPAEDVVLRIIEHLEKKS